MRGILGIVTQDGRVLMIRRSKNVRAPLTWCFPGGRIEADESQSDALVREMYEEVNIEVQPGTHLTTQTKYGGRLILYCWSAEITGGRLSPNPSEVAEVAWMTPEEVRRKEGVLPGTTDILDEIGL